MTSENQDLEHLIRGFQLSCQTEGKSPKTTEWYVTFVTRFLNFLKSNGSPTKIQKVGREHIRNFIRYLQVNARTPRSNKPLSPATVQGYVRSLKAFYAWAEREGYVSSNVMLKIPVPKAPAKVINTFTDEQFLKFVDLCKSSNATGTRNLAILLLMLDAGVRVSECKGIELSDVNLQDGTILIRHGKGSKERIVPIGSLVQKTLWKYIHSSRPKPFTSQISRLFLNSRGLPLTRSGIQQIIRRYGKKAGISNVRCSPHTFRHTFAKNYLLNGGDIFSLQRILGHSSLSSVRIYLNLFATDIKKQHLRFSPVDNLVRNPDFRRIYP